MVNLLGSLVNKQGADRIFYELAVKSSRNTLDNIMDANGNPLPKDTEGYIWVTLTGLSETGINFPEEEVGSFIIGSTGNAKFINKPSVIHPSISLFPNSPIFPVFEAISDSLGFDEDDIPITDDYDFKFQFHNYGLVKKNGSSVKVRKVTFDTGTMITATRGNGVDINNGIHNLEYSFAFIKPHRTWVDMPAGTTNKNSEY